MKKPRPREIKDKYFSISTQMLKVEKEKTPAGRATCSSLHLAAGRVGALGSWVFTPRPGKSFPLSALQSKARLG